MDWTKAKTILIVALLATNIFLLGSHAWRHSAAGEPENEAALLQLLSSRNITLSVEVPKSQKPMPILQGEYVSIGDEDIRALMGSQKEVSGSDDEDYAKAAEDFITYLGMMDDSLRVKSVEQSGDRAEVVFESKIGPVEVAGNFMKCTFEGGKICDFDYHWLKSTGLTQRKAELISAAAALLTLENEGGDAMEITGINLVYRVPENAEEGYEGTVSDTAFPTWEICTAAGEKIYVEAV